MVVGIGEDRPSGLCERARKLIERAEILVGGRRQLAFFAEHPAQRPVLAEDVDRCLQNLRQRLGDPPRSECVVLASGDPCHFGIGPLVVRAFGNDRVEILPHVGSVALAFARLGMGWQDARVLSAHGRPLEDAVLPALGSRKLAFFTDMTNTPSAIAAALLRAGVEAAEAWVLERLGGAGERIVHGSLDDIAAQQFDPLNVMVVIRKDGEAASPRFGRPESEYRQARGQITKAEVRAVSLSKLELPSDGVLWDVGAGSGSISIEATELAPGLTAFAVERDEQQLACLRANLRSHHVTTVQVVPGQAPESLAALPDPQRVFLGGHGGRLSDILELCLNRLPAGGRLVANFATLDGVAQVTSALDDGGWQWELSQLQVSRGQRVGPPQAGTRFEALNPVFVVSARRPDESGGKAAQP